MYMCGSLVADILFRTNWAWKMMRTNMKIKDISWSGRSVCLHLQLCMNEEKKDDFDFSSKMSRQVNIFAHVLIFQATLLAQKTCA